MSEKCCRPGANLKETCWRTCPNGGPVPDRQGDALRQELERVTRERDLAVEMTEALRRENRQLWERITPAARQT